MSSPFRAVRLAALLFLSLGLLPAAAQLSNLAVRVMAANITSGNLQSYEAEGIRIFQGLKPDVVAIQEFQVGGNSSSNVLRTLVDTAFGTNFHFYCEPNNGIPNGIVSRWPIVAAGSWDDPITSITDRGFAWALIDLPGTNDLYVVSVHLYSSGNEAQRNTEALEIKAQIQSNFPANAWIIVGGDFNTPIRTEDAIATFSTFLSDDAKPEDNNGDRDTNRNRNSPYDYVLPSFSLTNKLVPVVIGPDSFPSGLVFDSRIYAPLTNVYPVLFGDSNATNMQHMAVIKDFLLPVFGTNAGPVAPSITAQPLSQTNTVGSPALLSVTASGTAPLAHQWRFFGTNLPGATATNLSFPSLTTNDAGPYTVVITNSLGSVTSSVATLTVTGPLTNTPPAITTQPVSQSVATGGTASFFVIATGTAPLAHQWQLHGTNLPGATATNYFKASVTTNAAGPYTVIITNVAGAITSSVATLTVTVPTPPSTNTSVIAQWNFNSPTPDASTTTGTTNASIGTGLASIVGSVLPSFVTGGGADPTASDNTAWTTTSYPAASTGNKTAGVRFAVSTVGRQNITVSWSSQASNTGSKYGRLQYTTNGTDYVDFSVPATNAAGSFTTRTNNLAAILGANDNASFAIRIVTEFESTALGTGTAAYVPANPANTYGTPGTIRFDMVTIAGEIISPVTNGPPASAPALSTPALNAGLLEFTVTGTTGTNYIVQASTNLAVSNWFSLRTNAAPFSFTDSNLNSAPQKFYRGMLAP